MSEPDNFLSRWSRRKRAVANEESDVPAQPQPISRREGAEAQTAATESGKQDTAAFDLSKLPSLDSIGPGTDIRIFMQPGVPAALSRAALRRAWSADPAIRDFIGLSENSWDFTEPNSIIGFGELEPGEAARLLASAFGDPASIATAPSEQDAPRTDGIAAQAVESRSEKRLAAAEPANDDPSAHVDDASQDKMLHREDRSEAPQRNQGTDEKVYPAIRRGHGSALPD